MVPSPTANTPSTSTGAGNPSSGRRDRASTPARTTTSSTSASRSPASRRSSGTASTECHVGRCSSADVTASSTPSWRRPTLGPSSRGTKSRMASSVTGTANRRDPSDARQFRARPPFERHDGGADEHHQCEHRSCLQWAVQIAIRRFDEQRHRPHTHDDDADRRHGGDESERNGVGRRGIVLRSIRRRRERPDATTSRRPVPSPPTPATTGRATSGGIRRTRRRSDGPTLGPAGCRATAADSRARVHPRTRWGPRRRRPSGGGSGSRRSLS